MANVNQQSSLAIQDDPRWAAVRARDPSADGRFVYAVRTTGIYCRPSCTSRPAKRGNVTFYDSPAEAEAAGFRPCRRCRPDRASPAAGQAALVAELCRYIENAERAPTVDELAARAGISASHLHRLFRRITGVTPRAYAAANRADRLRRALDEQPTVTDALYQAGYSSSGRFYAESDRVLGMTPSAYRSGGSRQDIRFAVGECSLGSILVAESERGICAVWLGDEPEPLVESLQAKFKSARLIGGDDTFERRVAQVVGLVESPGQAQDCALPLDIRGTAFQQRVWQALRDIPAGETLSYTELAERIGSPAAVRAVAGACAANMLAVLIPCHRIVRRDGGLSGYRWGVERKRALLEREQSD